MFEKKNPEILAIKVVATDATRYTQTKIATDGVFYAKNGNVSLSSIGKLIKKKMVICGIDFDSRKSCYFIELDINKIIDNSLYVKKESLSVLT